jgi:cytochrome c peroxidase
MHTKYNYATVSEAINELKQKGYNLDFNVENNCIVCHPEKFKTDEFEIVEVYRYEGDSDPADEATVYGIQSKTGLKGILVTGYGISTDSTSTAILNKLSAHN